MRIRPSIIGISALILIVNTSYAQNSDDALAPLVNDQTLIVARGDLGRIDSHAFLGWMLDRAENAEPAARAMLEGAWKPLFDQWGGLLTEARDAGVKRAYWVLTLADLPQLEGAWAFPLDGKADAKKLIDALRRRNLDAKQFADLLVAAAPGRLPVPDPAGKLPQAWGQALGGAEDAPIRIAVVPTSVIRRSLEENLTSLPLKAGQVPITTLTRGIDWIALSVALPPNPSVRMVAQSPDGNAAQAVGELVNNALADLREYRAKPIPVLPAPAELADMLKPAVVGDQVRWEPDFAKLVMPVIELDLRQAVRIRSAANMRQILQGFAMYANNHQGQTAPDLNALIKDQNISPHVLIDPLNPDQKVGFIYVQPTGDWQKRAQDLLVLYESSPNGNHVGYADGHVAWEATHQQVEDQAKSARARNAAAEEAK